MLKHYLKIAFRISRKSGSISLINLLGLSIGLAICIIIFIYVRFETSYDRFHKDNDRIFRVEEKSNQHSNGAIRARCTNFIGLALKDLDEIQAVARISNWRPATVRFEDKAFKEDRIYKVSEELFNIFTFDVLEGSPSADMSRPYTTVLTETLRRRYFGEYEALGKMILVDTTFFEVVGVVKDIPAASHFKADLMLSYSTREFQEEMPQELILYGMSLYTYIKLKPNVDPVLFDNKIRNLPEMIAPDVLKESGEIISCFLDPVKDIHLNSSVGDDMEAHGNKNFLYLISAIGILVLLTTIFNYMNLSTARFISRAKELGVRKTFGATERQLILQFLGESVFIVFIAHIIAMAFVETSLVFINNLIHAELEVPFLDHNFLFFLLIIIFFTGIVAGSYPAFMLSSVDPVSVIKGTVTPGMGSHTFRRMLVLFQFMISIFLIMSTFLITRQINYMKNSPLGFVNEQKLVFQLPEGMVTESNYERVKTTFEEDPSVTGTTISSSVPGRWMYSWQMWPTGEKTNKTQIISCMQADDDFIRLYGLEVIAGELHNTGQGSEGNSGIIFNEAAVRTFGWTSPGEALAKTLFDSRVPIRAVFKDYHFKGKNQEIGPLGFLPIDEDYRYLTIVFQENMASEVLKKAGAKYKELFPDAAEDYFFLDEDFDRQYDKEQTTGNLVLIFTIFAIVVACLGLYGMTAYTLESKQHTYGIMKVNGASSKRIFLDILKEFMIWISLAFIIVSPVMYFVGKTWLMQFPYRTHLSIWIFVISGLILLMVTFITISLETYKIFKLNPVDTIRNE